VKDGAGTIVRTPESKPSDNLCTSFIEGKLTSFGRLIFSGRLTFHGNVSDAVRSRLIGRTTDESTRWVTRRLSRYFPGIDLKNHEVENLKENLNQPVRLTFEGTIPRFSTASLSRYFINPNCLERVTADDVPGETEEERRFPIHYRYAYIECDSFLITLPAKATIEYAPDPFDIETDFGSYKTEYTITDTTLFYSRTMTIQKKQIPLDSYADYKKLICEIEANDKAKFVFLSQ